MGLVDPDGEKVIPTITTPSSSSQISNPPRKKGTFDIPFLTGQSENSVIESTKYPIDEKIETQQDSLSEDSSDSSIDILTTNGSTESITFNPTQLNLSKTKHSIKFKNRKLYGNDSIEIQPLSRRDECHDGMLLKSEIFQRSLSSSSSSVDLVVPQLTSPFTFLHSQLSKGPPLTFSPSFPQIRQMSTGGKIRRGFESYTGAYASPYHPFLLTPSSAQVQTQEPTNHVHSQTIPTVLPPSLAALTLPAQNVCAKCKIGFRMTSDLVYHMRSHHKREADPQKKKREDKLKCPVCHETFRERHHLTRHMTAHQDRAEEVEETKATQIV